MSIFSSSFVTPKLVVGYFEKSFVKTLERDIEASKKLIATYEQAHVGANHIQLRAHIAKLQALLAERSDLCVTRLEESSLRLERYTKKLIILTIALVLLTVVLIVLTGILVHFPEDSKADKRNDTARYTNDVECP